MSGGSKNNLHFQQISGGPTTPAGFCDSGLNFDGHWIMSYPELLFIVSITS